MTGGVLEDRGGEGGEGGDVDYHVLERPGVTEYMPAPMKASPAAVN